ncbi:MAG: FKBP-type peptidyl-prolyl cis-trans isomerase [Opitutales bacterium]
MKLYKKSLVTLAILTLTSMTNLNADTSEDNKYLELYGQFIASRTGMVELSLTPAELEAVKAGMLNAIEGKEFPADMEEVAPKMQAYLEARAKAYSDKVLEAAKEKSQDFWNKLKEEGKAQFTPTGLAYEIIEAGDPRLPKETSFVVINYKGTLTDGSVFDQNEKAQFPLNGVIPGFREGLQKIGKGGKIKLYIPAELGYGSQNIPGIPAGSTLIFDVEMIDVADAPAMPEGMPQMQ